MWIFGTLAAGILPANVLRWYWWRLNGWGYAAGVLGGMLLSLGQVIGDNYLWRAPTPLYLGFPIIAIASTLITALVTLGTQPTDSLVLQRFYQNVQPAGAWGAVRDSLLPTATGLPRKPHFAREALNTALSALAICLLYIGTLYLVLHRHGIAGACFGVCLALCVALCFTWYRHLPAAEPVTDHDDAPLAPEGAPRVMAGASRCVVRNPSGS
jgi:hypothetical protein